MRGSIMEDDEVVVVVVKRGHPWGRKKRFQGLRSMIFFFQVLVEFVLHSIALYGCILRPGALAEKS